MSFAARTCATDHLTGNPDPSGLSLGLSIREERISDLAFAHRGHNANNGATLPARGQPPKPRPGRLILPNRLATQVRGLKGLSARVERGGQGCPPYA